MCCAFQPDIVHAHHPFLLGMTALRIARFRELPLVFTHHTLYEQYTHYVPGDSTILKHFAIELATRYANLADTVFAPSASIAVLLHQRGVRSPINVIPTGVELANFSQGDGPRHRQQMGIPEHAFLVGHLGRLAPEKNLSFLATSVANFIDAGFTATDSTTHHPEIHFLVVGTGPSEADIRAIFEQADLSGRLHIAGILTRTGLADAYHAMDVFAFASNSETQGMVLTEAMAAGKPVVALDAPGAREVVQDKLNGRLLTDENNHSFAAALRWVAEQTTTKKQALSQSARDTAAQFSMPNTAACALQCYEDLCSKMTATHHEEDEHWSRLLHLIKAEWEIFEGVAAAAGTSLLAGHTLHKPHEGH